MKRRALVVLALAACTANGDRVGTTRSAIQGGTTDATDSFAVAVLDDTGEVCSGTLIAPNLVLTARHCVADGGGTAFIDCAKDRFDAPRAASSFRVSADVDADFSTAEYAAAKVFVPKDTLFCGNDLALILLAKNVAGASVASPSLDVPNVKSITAIGYGTTSPGGDDDGTRRRLDGVKVDCVPGIPALDCDLSTYDMTKNELAAGDGLCEGDSGSGAYVLASAPVVVALLSRAGEDAGKCTDAIYTRTDAFGPLLLDAAKEAATAGGYALPAWANPPTSETDAGALEDDAAAPTTPANDGASAGGDAPATTTTTTAAGCALTPRPAAGVAWPAALACVLACARSRRKKNACPVRAT